MDDSIIRMYIDEVFQVYDRDRSGTLEFGEVHNFFNELYVSLNDTRRFTEQDIRMLITTIDVQSDQRITKPELFVLFKRIWEHPGMSPFQICNLYRGNMYGPNQNQGNQPPYYGQPQQYAQQQQYGQQYGQPQYGQQQYGQYGQYGQQGQNPYGRN